MITPSKFISFNKSVVGKLPIIIEHIDGSNICDLYKKVKSKFVDIDEFIFAIDVLYILDVVEFDPETGDLNYVS